MHVSTPPYKSSSAHPIDHLLLQREHLFILQHYLEWKVNVNDPGLASMYRDLVTLLGQATDQYLTLVNLLKKLDDQE